MLGLSFFSILWIIIKILLALIVGWFAVRLIIFAVPIIAVWIFDLINRKK